MLFRGVAALWGGDGEREPITATEKLWLIGLLTVGAVVWGVVRSIWNDSGVNGVANQVPRGVSIGFYLLLAIPALSALRSMERLLWVLGASVTVGVLPQVPLMPFAREGVHVVLLAIGLVAVIRLTSQERWPTNLPLHLYWGFLGVCGFSILFAQLLGKAGVWELKVGVAEMILYLAFGLAITALCRAGGRGRATASIIDGLAWTSLAQVLIMLVAIFLSIATPLVRGNDSLWGLGFWDRIKSTFAGPDNAGVFFTCTIPLMIYWGQQQVRRLPQLAAITYMQLVPWMIMATGSRGARIGMLVVLFACLASRQLRPWIVRALPSFIAASYVGFLFQSFPSALQAFLMPILDWLSRVTGIALPALDPNIYGMSLQGRFFEDKTRLMLLQESWEFFLAGSDYQQVDRFWLGGRGVPDLGVSIPT